MIMVSKAVQGAPILSVSAPLNELCLSKETLQSCLISPRPNKNTHYSHVIVCARVSLSCDCSLPSSASLSHSENCFTSYKSLDLKLKSVWDFKKSFYF